MALGSTSRILVIVLPVALFLLLLLLCIWWRWRTSNRKRRLHKLLEDSDNQDAFGQVELPNFEGNEEFLGQVSYAISYDVPTHRLRVTVLRASRLKPASQDSQIDSFVTVSLAEPEKQEKKDVEGDEKTGPLRRLPPVYHSPVQHNTPEPVFNFHVAFSISKSTAVAAWVLLEINDSDPRGRDRLIGGLVIRLDRYLPSQFIGQIMEERMDLVELCKVAQGHLGHICVSLRFRPPTQLLITVPEARDVLRLDMGKRKGRIFIMVSLYEMNTKTKEKSSRKMELSGGSNPYLDATVALKVDDVTNPGLALKIRLIFLSSVLGAREILGTVWIGHRKDGEGERNLLRECLRQPNRAITGWHEMK